jgi:hypothetical protein
VVGFTAGSRGEERKPVTRDNDGDNNNNNGDVTMTTKVLSLPQLNDRTDTFIVTLQKESRGITSFQNFL